MTAHPYQPQQLQTDALIELYSLDTTPMNLINGNAAPGLKYYWTPNSLSGVPLVMDGITYTPMPIDCSGFEWNGQGTLPQPKLTISNVGGLASALVIGNGDLVGSQVTRTRIFTSNLDGSLNPDTNIYFEPDLFTINRKSRHDKVSIEFELRAGFDAQGIKLPRRQIIRDACTQTYRSWNAVTNTFIQGSCPYTAAPCFDASGAATGSATDVCGKKMTDCQLRFGMNGTLPTYAFPGAGTATGVQ